MSDADLIKMDEQARALERVAALAEMLDAGAAFDGWNPADCEDAATELRDIHRVLTKHFANSNTPPK